MRALTEKADVLVADEICSSAYRRVWEERWVNTAQYWDGGDLGAVGERIEWLLGLLEECEGEAVTLERAVGLVRMLLGVQRTRVGR